jgi:mannosyltransferase OCH1-like enzyme
MKLFQYWDSPSPPAEIAVWVEGFKTNNPDFEHVLINRASALDFISEHYGPNEVAAFKACAVPAMQADYARLCFLETFGGVYVDADVQSIKPLSDLFKDCSGSMLFIFHTLVNNGVMYFPQARNPFVSACLKLATDNINSRRTNAVFTAAGPGVVNALRCILDPSTYELTAATFDQNMVVRSWGFVDLVERARTMIEITPELVNAFAAIEIRTSASSREWIGAEQPAYKETSVHWTRWEGSIYNEDPVT